MSNKNSTTKAFETVNKKQKGFKSNKSRQKFVIAIFVVIILILACLSTLIIGKIIDRLGQTTTTPPPPPSNVTYIPKDAGDLKLGYLLFLDSTEHKYDFDLDVETVKIYDFQKNSANNAQTKVTIGGTTYLTYALNINSLILETNTLTAFNKLMLDYCTENVTAEDILNEDSANNELSASGLQIAWGGYTDEEEEEYWSDLASSKVGLDYCDHALGTSITLRKMPPYSDQAITEELLKNEYSWIYENAHKYGFIIRYPNSCEHFGDDYNRDTRVHLRYVGVEHATYIHNANICLDEYLETLRSNHNSFENPLTFTANGKTYDVYYVKYTGNLTMIPVPKNNDNYVVSGDNMNGFIVTVEK